MNKRRKILTLLALLGFGVIIALHYCVVGGNNFIFFSTYHYPILRDIRMPLFVLAVLYVGLFFLLGGQDAKTRPKAGQTASPVPPSEDSENKLSPTPKKSKTKVVWLLVCLLVLAFGVVAYVATRYHAFANQLSATQGIHIGDSRGEVKYRLGFPLEVIAAQQGDRFGPWVYNEMPSNTKVEDYDEWVYEEPHSNVRLTVGFNKSGFVESLYLYSDNEKPYGWGAIAGLSSGDSEDKVLRLGQPSGQNLDGMAKTIEYRDIGIVVTLAKGRACRITIKGPQDKGAVFRRFIGTLP
jgi:hypothetical protein